MNDAELLHRVIAANDAELLHRLIAASGPPTVDDLTTFLRKRLAEVKDRADRDIASRLAVLDRLDAAVRDGEPRPYIDALLFVACQMGTVYDGHPDYKENWRP